MATKTFFLNSTVADYGEEEFNYLQKFLLDQGVLHTQGANWNEFIDLKVEESDTPDMGVKVAIGSAVMSTQRNDVDFKVFVHSNAEEILAISENTSGVDRVDAVILKLSRTAEPNALMNNLATIEVVDGTGATALSDEDIQTEIGADYDFIRLANITVEDSETTILDADIEDTRTRVLTTDAVQYSPTVLKFKVLTADPSSPVEGEMWYNSTDNVMRYYDGSNVIEMESSVYTGGNGVDISGGVVRLNFYFGDGSDGDVTIESDTSLTRDMYYDNLTINDGINLNPAGYRIFVKDTLTFLGTGKILQNGGDGEDGESSTSGVNPPPATAGGDAGTPPYTSASLPMIINGAGAPGACATGNTSVVGINSSVDDINKVYDEQNGKKGGNGGDTSNPAAKTGGVADQGLFSLPITKHKNQFLYDFISSFVDSFGNQVDIVYPRTRNSGGGSGAAATRENGLCRSGGGGGAGAHAGFICIIAKKIVNLRIEAKGGNGGDGGSGGFYGTNVRAAIGGSGGGAGGDGAIVFVFYRERTGTESITLTKGNGGLGSDVIIVWGSQWGVGTDGADGEDGYDGFLVEVEI